MDAFKKEKTVAPQIGRTESAQSEKAAAAWWANWANDHSDQIEAFNKDVSENGVWSDGLRSF